MKLTDIALNNLRRRKIKMAFVIFGMVFGVATIVTMFSITSTMQEEMKSQAQEAGTKIIVTPKSDQLTYSYGGISIDSTVSYNVKQMQMNTIDKIATVGDVNVIAPKVLGAIKVEGINGLLVGVDFSKELQTKSHWQLEGVKPSQANEILVGSKVSKKLGLNVNDHLEISSAKFVVTGIIKETGSEEDGLIFMNLEQAQTLLDKKGQLSFLEVVAFKAQQADEESVKKLVSKISEVLPEADVTAVSAAVEARKELVNRFSNFSVVISVVVTLVGSLIVLTTMMSSVNERTREIGIFRAIGFRKNHIVKIILMEAGIASAVSGLFGYVLGNITAASVAPLIVELQGTVRWNPILGISVIVGALAVGLCASWYPAVKATKLDPAEALRFI